MKSLYLLHWTLYFKISSKNLPSWNPLDGFLCLLGEFYVNLPIAPTSSGSLIWQNSSDEVVGPFPFEAFAALVSLDKAGILRLWQPRLFSMPLNYFSIIFSFWRIRFWSKFEIKWKIFAKFGNVTTFIEREENWKSLKASQLLCRQQ